jgi:hypothetical protein
MPRMRAGFVKGSLLSFVVFGAYDLLLLRRLKKNDVNQDNSSSKAHEHSIPSEVSATRTTTRLFPTTTILMHSWIAPHRESASPLYHFGSGALSGILFSLVLDAWDVGVFVARGHDVPPRLNAPLVARRALHHSVGYATLFGSFEVIRRQLDDWSMTFFSAAAGDDARVANVLDVLTRLRLINHHNDEEYEKKSYNMSAIPLVTAFVAGGFAGQLHYVADHCTRHWRRSAAQKDGSFSFLSRLVPRQLPNLKATMAAFGPTAFCFVLFQYGSEIVDRMCDDVRVVRYPYPGSLDVPR